MKVGILTFHRPINYGAFLQAYSLSTEMQRRFPGCEVSIIDYIAPAEKSKIYINVLRTLKHEGVKNACRDIKKICVFKKAQKHLSTVSIPRIDSNLNALYVWIDSNFDVLVIGSDAVFNWNQNGYPTAFIPDYEFKRCRVMSYAASVHGLRFFEEAPKRIATCGNVFAHMQYIGVRDQNTCCFVEYCNSNAKPAHCCDPTLFINKEYVYTAAGNYRDRIAEKYGIAADAKYIVLMIQDKRVAEIVAKRYRGEYKIIALFKDCEYADSFLYDLNPFEWVSVLRDASLVVTSYFHGTLLGFVQDVPTVVIDGSQYTDGVYEGKLKDFVFTRIGVSELFFEQNDVTEEKLLTTCSAALSGVYASRVSDGVAKEKSTCEDFFDQLSELVTTNR